MHTITRIFGSLALAAAASGAAAQQPARIQVSIDMPARVQDATPLHAQVTLTNNSKGSLSVAPLQQDLTLFARIVPVQDYRTGKCHSRTVRTGAAAVAAGRIPIAARGELSADLDLLDPYPFGLPPGRYRLFVDYRDGARKATSEPVEFEVVIPPGEEYQSFLQTCRALSQGGGGADQALQFVKAHPRFFFADELLTAARNRADGEPRMELNQLILARNASPQAVEYAERDLRDLATRSKELAAYAKHVEEFRAQLKDASNAAAARDFQQLGTILDTAGFDRHEQFLRNHPGSFFAAEALHGMIEAISQGVLPRGSVTADADRLLIRYYDRLLRSDTRNYWVQRAQRDPAVAQLIARGARE
jgi:hypothetical protein